MKSKTQYIIIIITLLLIIAYLVFERSEALESQDSIYQESLYNNMDDISNALFQQLPVTLDLYSNDFTEKELELFKNSLGNVMLLVENRWSELDKIERYYGKEHNLSQSIVTFSNLMVEVKENAGVIDEDVFYQISDTIQEYKKSFPHPYNTSLENVFNENPKLLNAITIEIQDLVELKI